MPTRTDTRTAVARRAVLAAGLGDVLAAPAIRPSPAQGAPTRVGVLHLLFRTMAISETALRDTVLMMNGSTQPSIIKDTARAVRHLARERGLAVVLVEQHFEFARDLADRIVVAVRGEVALGGPVDALEDEAVRRLLTV